MLSTLLRGVHAHRRLYVMTLGIKDRRLRSAAGICHLVEDRANGPANSRLIRYGFEDCFVEVILVAIERVAEIVDPIITDVSGEVEARGDAPMKLTNNA